MNKLVIFDLDGVLFESRDMHYVALNRALMFFGYKPISVEDHATKYNGLPTIEKLKMLGFEDYKMQDVIQERKQHYTREWLSKNVHLDHGLIRLFSDLRAADYRIAVASNAVKETVLAGLKALGLSRFGVWTYSPDMGLKNKPDPALFFRAMADTEADPTTTIIIEDSVPGLEAARATGAKVIEVKGPYEVVSRVRKECL